MIERNIPSITQIHEIIGILHPIWGINKEVYQLFVKDLDMFCNKNISDDEFQDVLNSIRKMSENGWLND